MEHNPFSSFVSARAIVVHPALSCPNHLGRSGLSGPALANDQLSLLSYNTTSNASCCYFTAQRQLVRVMNWQLCTCRQCSACHVLHQVHQDRSVRFISDEILGILQLIHRVTLDNHLADHYLQDGSMFCIKVGWRETLRPYEALCSVFWPVVKD